MLVLAKDEQQEVLVLAKDEQQEVLVLSQGRGVLGLRT